MMIAGTEHRRQGCSLQDGKQWGYYVESQNPTDYRYWSIPFTSHYITMATKTYYEPKEEAVPWLVGIDMQKFICGYGANFIGSSYVSCVGIGCQPQWGINSAGNDGSEGESGWYAFPVNFNSACFALFCGLRNTDTNKTYTNKIMAVIHGLVVSFGLLLADSQPVTSYNPTATL